MLPVLRDQRNRSVGAYRARRRVDESGDHRQQRRLATAVGADESIRRPGAELDRRGSEGDDRPVVDARLDGRDRDIGCVDRVMEYSS